MAILVAISVSSWTLPEVPVPKTVGVINAKAKTLEKTPSATKRELETELAILRVAKSINAPPPAEIFVIYTSKKPYANLIIT